MKGSVFVPAWFPAGFTTETRARRNATLRSSSPSPGELIPSPLPTSILGRESTGELNTWGSAHVPLWDAIRAKGIRVEVVAIGAELDTVLRADRVLQAWAAAPGKDATGPTVKQEMAAIKDAIHRRDREFLATYGGMGEAGQRYVELHKLPEANLEDGVKIDEFSTYRATRFADPV